jgi:hypothetical protein
MGWAYEIMHLERPVAVIDSDGICRIAEPDFLPYNLYLEEEEDISARINNLTNYYYWCATRVLTLDRGYAKEVLNAIGATQAVTDKERAQIALSYHCVTLTDVFWTRKKGETVTYSELNLYAHSLSDAFVDVSLLGKNLTVENAELLKPSDTAGDVSTQGAVPKAWIRRDGQFYLLKDGGERDVNAELLASRIARCFDVEQVLYEPAFYQGTKVTKSCLITSLGRSIVPMEYVEIYAVNHDTNRMELVEKYDAYGYHMMNIIDYLIGNTDRHWGNWGFWIDTQTNLPVRLYPLMDFNKSFLAYDKIEGSRCLTSDKPVSQLDAARQGVREVGLNQTCEIQREWFESDLLWEMFRARLRELERSQEL